MKRIGDSLKLTSTPDAERIQYVIARYNEDVSWATDLKHKIIYDKGTPLPGSVVLPNIGREAHTYLHHVITNYDTLAEYTCFLQGHPFDHCPDVLARVRNRSNIPFTSLPPVGYVSDRNGLPQQVATLPIGQMYDRFFADSRSAFTYIAGAQFIVSRARIRSRPKWFYEKLLNEDPLVYPWAYERLWRYIFGEEPIRLAA